MSQDLNQLANSVETEQDLLNFVQALMNDRTDEEQKEKVNPSSPYSSGVNGWENGDIVSFLDAALAWGKASTNGLEFYEKPENPWKRIAHILHAGKFYE
ncbi:DUF7660 family protein [Algibacillus agarilyticus]|uniref:DUF7660 family protein n=1 Tax=Algibacillus agarilyticus TaxID=2234133 RepID=UPI000DCFE116|nr:hypothetical protein [Algibacillus agarilyticus]